MLDSLSLDRIGPSYLFSLDVLVVTTLLSVRILHLGLNDLHELVHRSAELNLRRSVDRRIGRDGS